MDFSISSLSENNAVIRAGFGAFAAAGALFPVHCREEVFHGDRPGLADLHALAAADARRRAGLFRRRAVQNRDVCEELLHDCAESGHKRRAGPFPEGTSRLARKTEKAHQDSFGYWC